MPTMTQNRRTERSSIIQWILTLEQERMLLDGRFERFRRDVETMVMAFIQRHGVDVGDSWSVLRERVGQSELADLRREIDLLLAEELTPDAKVETEKLKRNDDRDLMDLLATMIALETIKTMNQYELTLNILIENTIKTEWIKQGSMINLDQQGIETHLDRIYKSAITQDNWSARIWGIYQKDLRDNVERLVRDSLVRGYNPRLVAEELREITNRTKYETERLMRTETARVQGMSQLEAYNAQGIEWFDLIPEPDACDKCKRIAKEGPYSVASAEIGVNVEPIHPNCRCSTVGVLD